MGGGRRAARLAGGVCVALATLCTVAAWPAGTGLVRVDGVSGTGTPSFATTPNAQVGTAAAGGAGQSLVVWVDSRTGSFDLYGSRVGTGGALLDPAGIRIATDVGSPGGSNPEQHAVGFDGTQWLVVWRVQNATGLYAARIDTAGAVLDAGGFALTPATDTDSDPSVAGNPNGGFLVVWHRPPPSTGGYDAIRAAQVDASGGISRPDYLLTQPGIHPVVAWAGSATTGSYLLAFGQPDLATGWTYLFLLPVKADGTPGPGAARSMARFDMVTYPVVAGTTGGQWLVAFEENTGSTPAQEVRFIQIDNVNSTVGNTVGDRHAPRLAGAGATFLLADVDTSTGSAVLQASVVTPVPVGGTGLPTAGNELALTAIGGTPNSTPGPAAAFDGTDWLVADQLPGMPPTVRALNLAVGPLGADGSSMLLNVSADEQATPAVAGAAGGFAFAWTDLTSNEVGMELLDAQGNVTPVTLATPGSGVWRFLPSVSPDASGWALVYALTNAGSGIQAVHVSSAGVASAPIDVSTSALARSPATAFDGTEDLVAFADGGAIDTYWVTPSTGTVTHAHLASGGTYGVVAPAAAAGGGKVLVSWVQHTGQMTATGDLKAMVLDHASGSVTGPFAVATGVAAAGTPAVASDGTRFLVAWAEEPGGSASSSVVRFATVDAAGTVGTVNGPPGTPTTAQTAPAATFDGQSYLVLWQEGLSPGATSLVGTRVGSDGLPTDTAPLPFASGVTDAATPALAADGSGHDVVGYAAYLSTEGGVPVGAQRVQATRFRFDQPPVATPQTVNATEDTSIAIQLGGTDPDGDALTFALSPTLTPAHGTVSGTPPSVTYTPDANYNGDDSFGFTVSDSVLVSPAEMVTIHVAPVNDPPVVDPVADASVDEGSPLVVGPVAFSDPDVGDTWTASADVVGTGPGTLNVTSSSASAGQASATLVFSNDGVYHVELCVTDQGGLKGCSPFTVTVANVPPSVTGITTDPSPATEGALLTLTAQATDPGTSDVLTYAWTFDDGSTSTDVHPTHTYANNGSYAVTVTVSDGTDSTSYAGQVVVENVAPTPVDPGSQTVAPGRLLAIDLEATDPGADTLTWTKTSGVGSVTPAGHYTWTPPAGGTGSYTVGLAVSDGDGGTASLTVSIDVVPGTSGITTIYGCSSAGGGTSPEILGLLLALFALCVFRRRPRLRTRHASVLVLAIAIAASPLAHAAGATPKRPQLAFLGIRAGAGIDQKLADTVGDYVYTELARIDVYQVMSMSDIKALLGLEAKKQLMGCSDGAACLAQIGGALGAARLLTGDLSRVGDSIVLNLSLLDVPHAKQVARVGARAEAAGSLDAILDAIPGLLRRAAEKDGLHVTVAPPEVVSLGRVHFVAGLRGEGELLGPGGALGIEVGLRAPHFGVSLVGIPRIGSQPNPSAPRPFGLRLEGRVTPWQLGRVLPYLALGATVFFPDIGARGALGLEIAMGQMRLSVDVGAEYLLNAAGLFAPLSVLVSGGVAYAF